MQTQSCDVVIVGGGMAGLAMASMLAQFSPFTITLLEAKSQHATWSSTNPMHRVSAFTISSQRIFKSLGVWTSLQEKRVSPFERIEVSDEQHGFVAFDSHEIAEPALGFIIENNLIESVLTSHLQTYHQVQVKRQVKLSSFIHDDQFVHLSLSDGTHLQTRLLIAADGGQSWVRKTMGMSVTIHDYHQQGFIASLITEKPHHRIARQQFLSTGPLAFLPLQNPQASSIVWSLPSELATQYAAMPSHNLISILEKACSKQLGDIQTISKSFLFPLVYRRVNQYVKDRIVLIGDAAHTIHPMAGQGINMGLLDAAYLLDVLQEAKFDLSCKQLSRYLRSYERARKADNDIMLKSVHLLHRLFANKINAVQSARSLGLNMTAQCTWLKNQFTRHAIGDRMGMPMLTKIFEDTF